MAASFFGGEFFGGEYYYVSTSTPDSCFKITYRRRRFR